MKYSAFTLALTALSLSSCVGLTGPVIMGADAAGIYVTQPEKPPGPDTADQIPPHESWCYRTSGYAQCYAHPQNVAPDRLINVDPASAYPIDLDAYRQALVAKPIVAVQSPQIVVVPTGAARVLPAPDVQMEKATLKDELSADHGNAGSALPVAPQPLQALPPPGVEAP